MALLEANRGRAPIKAAPSAGKIAAAVLRPILPSRAMSLNELQRRWREIAGEQISKSATPEKLAAGVL
ncbi:MAG: DciA family protein, partial [Caulobacterales bacterium]